MMGRDALMIAGRPLGLQEGVGSLVPDAGAPAGIQPFDEDRQGDRQVALVIRPRKPNPSAFSRKASLVSSTAPTWA